MLRQTVAIFLDAYRGLRDRKMFWVVLAISGLVVAFFAMLGIGDNGLQILFWEVPLLNLNAKTVSPDMFYKTLFTSLGVNIWLALVATILALISTASIFPEFIKGGSIQLVLSKPIGRLRLFLTQYLAAMLFVVLQVAIFCVGSFLVLGLRGGVWEPRVFMGVPIVVLFYSYLYCICVLIGVRWRSTVAAVLLTILAWGLLWIVGQGEVSLTTANALIEAERRNLDRQGEQLRARVEQVEAARREGALTEEESTTLAELRHQQEQIDQERQSGAEFAAWFGRLQKIFYAVKWFLPKTGETKLLLERALIPTDEALDEDNLPPPEYRTPTEEALLQTTRALRNRSVWWIVGTSLPFEFVVLGLAAWRFCRSDY